MQNKLDTIEDINPESLLSILRDYYAELENNYSPIVVNLKRHSTPVNFKESLSVPIHRWYNYKEGFSPKFVRDFIQKYASSTEDVVFDPFGGVGTTVLEASLLGYQAYSTDVNPLGNFASKVKSRIYTQTDIAKLKQQLVKLASIKDFQITCDVPNSTVVSYFLDETYNSLLQIISYIRSIEDKTVRDFFQLALLSIVEILSTHKKDGNGLKRKKNPPIPMSMTDVISLLSERIHTYIEDIANSSVKVEPTIFYQSNIDNYSLPRKADIVITSPPYANCFDYSKVYMNELWVGGFFLSSKDQTIFREKSVSSHVHYRWQRRNEEYTNLVVDKYINRILATRKLWSNTIPEMLSGYFSDMGKFLYILSQNLNKGATVGIVVGNSVYAGLVIPTDLLLASMAENLGYDIEGIHIYRELSSSPQQMKLVSDQDRKYLRESLIILKWNK